MPSTAQVAANRPRPYPAHPVHPCFVLLCPPSPQTMKLPNEANFSNGPNPASRLALPDSRLSQGTHFCQTNPISPPHVPQERKATMQHDSAAGSLRGPALASDRYREENVTTF